MDHRTTSSATRRFCWIAAVMFGLGAGAHADAPAPPKPAAFDPTSHYVVKQLEGWTVLVNKKLLAENPGLYDRVETLLRLQLQLIVYRLPPAPVAKLKKVKIWLELREPHHPCAAYHPDTDWLGKNGMNPAKKRCVELANAENFLTWCIDQPWMVLHELAHAYHDQFLPGGFDNPEVKAAHQRAANAKSYENVLRINGKRVRHYAIKNPMEYFAEATEAYFGTNDYYPFVRAELAEHDPEMFKLLGKLWETEPAKKK